MPLHLLPKKSWHVYNTANVERVRRDEAAAAAREAAQEEQMQEEDAARRMAILRGEAPPAPLALPAPEDPSSSSFTGKHARDREAEKEAAFLRPEKKKRKRWDENDTEYEMRLAQDTLSQSHSKPSLKPPPSTKPSTSNEPITDTRGHISLFPSQESANKKEKNAEAEAEAAKQRKELEDQYTMRFSNAAGFKEDVGAKPWYLSGSASKNAPAPTTTDAPGPEPSEKEDGGAKKYDYMEEKRRENERWGRKTSGSDAGPQSRPRKKLITSVTDDPLAMMKKGAAQVRQVARERQEWIEKREREMRNMDRIGRDDDLEDFSLDASEKDRGMERRREKRHGESHRNRDGDRERRHHREHRHRSRHHHRHH